MKYKPSSIIVENRTGQIKIISESELIGDVEIYYMTDGTSYADSEIKLYDLKKEDLKIFLEENTTVITELIDYEKIKESFKRQYELAFPQKNKKIKVKYWPFPSLNLFPKAFRLWTSRG